MSRRGLVSKSFGPPGGPPGGPALMPKGEKPSPSSFLSVEDVASTLRVQPSQVLEWVQRDQLRGNDSGIKPYDLKKFQLDHGDDIRKAQAKNLKDGQKSVDKRPNKGGGGGGSFLSRLFGGKKDDAPATSSGGGGGDATLAQENRRLREELKQARAEAPDPTASAQLEDKVRYLEGKLAKTSSLEAEVNDLRRQLVSAEKATPTVDPGLERELESTRRELNQARELAQRSESLEDALRDAERERERLREELARTASLSPPPAPGADDDATEELRLQLEESRFALQQAENRLKSVLSDEDGKQDRYQRTVSDHQQTIQQLHQEIEALRSAPAPAAAEPVRPTVELSPVDDSPLVEELLALQEVNFSRFARLRDLYDQAQARLAQAPAAVDAATEANFTRLQSEFDTLRVKHQSLLEARETNLPGHNEYVEQLAAARVTTTRLKQENTALKTRLSEADVDSWRQKVDELQQRLTQGSRASDANLELAETELRAVRKSLQSREAQVQKIAGRLQENERALKKALKESTRLTELLIERENRLRDLSIEYEQEYRDKIDNLDRQVSGLQWKLSLREERIASLETEVSELRKAKG